MESEKKKRFCEEFIIDLNGSAAAIRAGYSEKTARQKAYELLNEAEVQTCIKQLQSKLSQNCEVSAEEITNELKKIAFSSIANLHNSWIERKQFEELSQDQKDSIESIETKVLKKNIGTADKPEIVDVEYVKIKLYDKLKALENLAKRIGYYEIDNRQRNNETVIIMPSNDRD